jgi:hypothetical protein
VHALLKELAELEPEAQAQAERIMHSVILCFQNDFAHGVWLFTTDDAPAVAVLTANCSEIGVAELFNHVDTALNIRALNEAPPIEERH